jgi:hypothetical protein
MSERHVASGDVTERINARKRKRSRPATMDR